MKKIRTYTPKKKVREINISEKRWTNQKKRSKGNNNLGSIEGALLVGEGKVGCVCKWFK